MKINIKANFGSEVDIIKNPDGTYDTYVDLSDPEIKKMNVHDINDIHNLVSMVNTLNPKCVVMDTDAGIMDVETKGATISVIIPEKFTKMIRGGKK